MNKQAVQEAWAKIGEQAPDDHMSILKYVFAGEKIGPAELVTQAMWLLCAAAYLSGEKPSSMADVLQQVAVLDKGWDNAVLIIDEDINTLKTAAATPLGLSV